MNIITNIAWFILGVWGGMLITCCVAINKRK